MRSKASFRGHPNHPALIPFPLAFLTGAFLFDLVGVVINRPALWTTGAYLIVVGVITGVFAAIPGLIDFLYTVPPNSSGKARALKHASAMVSALILFTIAKWLRGDVTNQPGLPVLVLEAIGAASLTIGGWLGGVLVSRNQVSIDHRYAGAGKWKEENVDKPASGQPVVVGIDGLETNQMKLVHVAGKRLVVARMDKGWAAFDDRCTHKGGSLADGAMICGSVQCPWHGSQFDVATGSVKSGPARESIKTYRAEPSGHQLKVWL
ncbi:MAG: hypothetical protein DMD72_10905 [Gemmatimonadetes bacterium]|nr:MAG: hypothetical protein DMD72_10905 [Gemmatimonadota bacterium]